MGSARNTVKTGPNQYRSDGLMGAAEFAMTPNSQLRKDVDAAYDKKHGIGQYANRTVKPSTGGALISKSTPSPEWRRRGRLSLLNANQETVGGQKRTLG
jgi:hypothetical protein